MSESSVGEALAAAIDALHAIGVDSPRLDAEVLMAEASGMDRAQLVARPETPLPAAAARRFAEMVRRRLRREPVAYITARRWFRHLELRCDRRALIPRPETELLVEVALELGDANDRGDPPIRVLDIGTGTGAVALAIAAERPGWRVTASDTSLEALALARENATVHGLVDRVELIPGTLPGTVVGDESAALATEDASVADGATVDQGASAAEPASFDVIVANLPYVPDGDWSSLAPEIRDYEPRNALLAGADGLDVVRVVVARIKERFAPDLPAIALEIGAGQADAVAALLREAGWPRTESMRDLAAIERVVVGDKPPRLPLPNGETRASAGDP